MKDPTSSVSHTPKKRVGKKQVPKGTPHFTSVDYEKAEPNQIPNFYNQSEMDYLQRMKLRAKLNQIAKDQVPPPSDFEAMLSSVQAELNRMYELASDQAKFFEADNVKARSNLEILYSRFGTRSLFNIANEIASARLQKQGIKEIEAMVENPSSAVDVILGGKDSSSTNYNYQVHMSRRSLKEQGSTYYTRPSLLGTPAVPSGSK